MRTIECNELLWENVYKQYTLGKYPSEDLIRFIARYFYPVKDRSSIKILEIGCGSGPNLCYLASEKFTPYGIDFSKTAIDITRRNLGIIRAFSDNQFVVGDISNLPFEDAFFDAVIDIEAVYCNSYEKSIEIYKEAARVCKPGGYIYSRTFAIGCYGEGTGVRLGHNAWQTTEGPFLGKGYARFTERSEIPDLFSSFNIVNLELVTRTVNGLENEIKEWTITGRK